jgi:hypothetical protein
MMSKDRKGSTHLATVHQLKALLATVIHSFFHCKEEVHELKDKEIEKVLEAKYQMTPHY